MTPDEWSRSNDGEALLTFASERIPIAHLCLVLGDLTGHLLAHAYDVDPVRERDSWPAAWGLATLRAWCFGAARRVEVVDARNEVQKVEWALRHSAQRALHVGYDGLSASLRVVTELDLGRRLVCSERLGRLVVATNVMSRGRLAVFIRDRVAFPTDAAQTWEPQGSVVRSGDTLLRIRRWGIADAVSLECFAALEPKRAVAFDDALMASEHWSSPDTAPLTGCVVTLVDMGGQLSRRISCYDPAPLPSPPQRALPLSLPKPAPRVRARPRVPAFVPPVVVEEEEVVAPQPSRVAAPVAKPKAALDDPFAGWRWVFVDLLGCVWIAIENFGWNMQRVISAGGWLLFAVIAVPTSRHLLLELHTRFRWEPIGKALLGIAMGWFVLAMFVSLPLLLSIETVHWSLDLVGYDTSFEIRRHELDATRLRAELAVHETPQLAARLKDVEDVLRNTTLVSRPVENFLAVLSLAPTLMVVAWILAPLLSGLREHWKKSAALRLTG